MTTNVKKIIEAKFNRDAKGLNNTFLVNTIPSEILNYFEMLNHDIVYSSGESPIIFYYENNDQWYIISEKKIVEKKGDKVIHINLEDVVGVNSLLIYQKDIVEEKRKGLDYILLLLKNGDTHKLNVEKKSFSVIDGVISYLVDKVRSS